MNTRLFAMLVVVLALTGCARTQPVHNINETLSVQYKPQQIKNAILQAGIGRGWGMTQTAPGVISGHLEERGHRADIRITYAASQYSINYVDSQNLLAKNGIIHRNYNRWVSKLDQDIKTRLAMTQISN